MIFANTIVKKLKSFSKKAQKCRKVSDLKECLCEINNILDKPVSQQVIDFIKDEIDQTGKVCEKINGLVAQDYVNEAQEMANEFSAIEVRREFSDLIKTLKYHPNLMKKELIGLYKRVKVEEKTTAIQNNKNSSLAALLFHLGAEQSQAEWEREIAQEAEERLRTDNVIAYEEEKSKYDRFQQIWQDIQRLKKMRNNIASIDKINLSIKKAISMYKVSDKVIQESLKAWQDTLQVINKIPQSDWTGSEDQKESFARIKVFQEQLDDFRARTEAILTNNEYPIDYLEKLAKSIEDTCAVLLLYIQIRDALGTFKIERITYSYTRGKTPKSAQIILEINGGTPIRFKGLRARNIYEILSKRGIGLDTEKFEFTPHAQKKTLSQQSDLLQKEWNKMNQIVAKKWREYGFSREGFDLISYEGYSHGINPKYKDVIK